MIGITFAKTICHITIIYRLDISADNCESIFTGTSANV